MAKRGPKTEAGKESIRLNAVRHGVLSTTPVIPGLERNEDWEAHCSGVLASLRPDGHLETALAERVALQLWRLQRLARYERDTIALAQERAEPELFERRQDMTTGHGRAIHASAGEEAPDLGRRDRSDLPGSLEQMHELVEHDQATVRMLGRLPQLPDCAPLTRAEADQILYAASGEAGVDMEAISLPDIPSDVEGWTAGLVRRALAYIAALAKLEERNLLAGAMLTTTLHV